MLLFARLSVLEHQCVHCVSDDAISSSVSALAFGLSPTVWLYASQAEVFALHNLGMALLLWLTIRVFEASDATNLLIGTERRPSRARRSTFLSTVQ